MNIGLYFGTFNPIHVGHLVIASYMAQREELDQVWLVVSPQNPHKAKENMLPDFQRLDLVRTAIDDDPRLRVTDVEFKLARPSYTVNTLAHLKEKYPTHQFTLIMGEDNLRSLHRWYNFEYILENYPILVYPRIETDQEQSLQQTPNELLNHPSVQFCADTPVMKISSSFIRQQIRAGKDVRYLLTEPVYRYVDEMRLYKSGD